MVVSCSEEVFPGQGALKMQDQKMQDLKMKDPLGMWQAFVIRYSEDL